MQDLGYKVYYSYCNTHSRVYLCKCELQYNRPWRKTILLHLSLYDTKGEFDSRPTYW